MNAAPRAIPLPSHLLLATTMWLVACGDDGVTGSTTTETGTTGQSETTVHAETTNHGATTTGDPTSADQTTADPTTAGSDATTGGSTSSSTSDGTTSDSSSTTGTAAFDVPFAVLDPYPLPLTTRVQSGWRLITSEAEWSAETGAPVPMGVSFPSDWVVLGSRGPLPFPGHDLVPTALTWDDGMLVIDGTAAAPAANCDTFQFTWPADTLLVIEALDVEVSGLDDQTTPAVTSCAAGAGNGMSCDRDTPCATGLSCAGLIRSTVLINNPGGLCLPSSYAGVFTGGGLVIPSNGTTAEASQVVGGLTSVDMDVVIWVELDHPAPQELVIELRNPSDNQVQVASLQSSPLHPGGVGIVPTGFSGDESVNGTWWLVVRDDVVNASNGSVISWELEIMSRFD